MAMPVEVIRTKLNGDDSAVEKACVMLSQGKVKVDSAYDRRGADYYASWILSGKRLDGAHLTKARNLALKYAADIAAVAKAPAAALPIETAESSLTMNRKGSFDLYVYGPNHCGVGTGTIAVQYHARIVCDAKVDNRGFLFDQVMVASFFNGIKQSSLSCEKLVMHCAAGLAKRIVEENPSVVVRSIELTLSPAPHAADMTYTWRRKLDDDLSVGRE